MSCGGRRTVNVTKTRKWMERKRRKKTTDPQKKGLEKKVNFLVSMVLGRIDPSPQSRGLQGPPFGPQVPPERLLMTNYLTPSPLYRNIVIT